MKDRIRKTVDGRLAKRTRELVSIAEKSPDSLRGMQVEIIDLPEANTVGLRVVEPKGFGDRAQLTAVVVGEGDSISYGQSPAMLDHHGSLTGIRIPMDSSSVMGAMLVMQTISGVIQHAEAA